jgi:chromosome segregation ATPase
MLEEQKRRLSDQDDITKRLQDELATAKSAATKEKKRAAKYKDEISKLKSQNVELQRRCDTIATLAEEANTNIVAHNNTVAAQQARIKKLEECELANKKKLLHRKKLQAEVADLKRQIAGKERKRRRDSESTDEEVSRTVGAL